MISLYRQIKLVFKEEEVRRFYLLLVAVVFLALFEMSSVGLIAPFLSMLMDAEMLERSNLFSKLYEYFGVTDKRQFVIYLGIFVFSFYIVTNLYIVVVNWLIFYFSLNQGYKISSRLFSSYISRNYLFFTIHNTAELSRAIFQDVARLTDNVLIPFLIVISRTASAIAILILLAFVSLRVTLLAALLFGGCYFFIFVNIRHLLVKIGERFTFYNKLRFRIVSEAFGGIKDCKIYNAADYFISSFRDSSYHDAKNQTKRRTLLLVPRYLIDSIVIGALVIFSIILYSQGNNAVLVGTLSVFAIAAVKLMPAIQQIYANFSLIKSNRNALDLVLNDLQLDRQDLDSKPEQRNIEFTFDQSLKIENLSFSYPSSKDPVIKNLSLEIKPKTITGIAGSSGSGKSTFIDILLGLLEYHEGKIMIDGQLMNHWNSSPWQRLLGYVPQTIYLIDASIAENIAFGIPKEKIDYDKVRKVICDAQLESLVNNELSDGIDTVVGEKGVRLSGGQIQRIGIARALYRDPEVLIFDEATSALDSITEKLIVDTICGLADKITVIMIAHRLTTLRHCDSIYVMENGGISTQDSYHELMASNAYFQNQ